MTTRIGVQVPPGLSSGQSIQFQTPSGMMMQAQIPAGVSSGQTFYVDVPAAAPVAVAQAVPMGGGVPMGGAVPMGSAVDGGGSSVPMGMPMVSSQVSSERGVAEAHAECPICIEALHKAPGGVFALLEAARREEAELAAETAMLDSLHREAEERVLLQRQLNMEAAAEKKQLERRETRRRLRAERKAAQEA